jgi:hypothetical protein
LIVKLAEQLIMQSGVVRREHGIEGRHGGRRDPLPLLARANSPSSWHLAVSKSSAWVAGRGDLAQACAGGALKKRGRHLRLASDAAHDALQSEALKGAVHILPSHLEAGRERER